MYVIPPDSRVADAVEAAGGWTEEADQVRVNLALPLHDGDHVHVPARAEKPCARGSRAPTPIPAFPLDVNTASPQELEAIPGIGPTMARRIVENRPYAKVEDLLRVPGIGPATLERIRPYVTVSPVATPAYREE